MAVSATAQDSELLSSFTAWRWSMSVLTGLGLNSTSSTSQEVQQGKAEKKVQTDCRRCEKWRDAAIAESAPMLFPLSCSW